MTARLVAIDGPAGSGKSTAARGVAAALGLHTLDTGAMYRAVTLAVLDRAVDLEDGETIATIARDIALDLEDAVVRLDGRDVSDAIRGPDVTAAVSAVSSHSQVRKVLVERQRVWVRERGGGVVEGRDIGTVVFPDAPVKIFLTADDGIRARRRRHDEALADRDVAVDDVRTALTERDQADSSLGRALRPEDAAPDAFVIDTTGTSVEEVVAAIVERARAGSSNGAP